MRRHLRPARASTDKRQVVISINPSPVAVVGWARTLFLLLAITLPLVSRLSTAFAETPGSLSGSVYESGSGRGVADVEVTLRLSNGRGESRRTGSDGGFSFEGLLAGRYTVSIALPGGYRSLGDTSRSVTVNARKATGGVDFAVAPKATPTPVAKPTSTPTPSPEPGTPVAKPGSTDRPDARSPESTAERPIVLASPSPLPVSSTAVAGASPSPLFTSATSPAAGATVGPSPSASAPPLATTTSGDDILAGRGLHWNVGEAGPVVSYSPGVRPGAVADAERRAPARPMISSLEPLRRLAVGQLRSWSNDSTLWLGVPFKTQIDDTDYAMANCGPASLAMVMSAFGVQIDPPVVRDYVNYLSGDYSTDDGTSLHVIARVAQEAGLSTWGVNKAWSVDAVREHVRAGHPVITLAKYRSLPGNGNSFAEFDHYIVITGLAGDDLIYNDAAFSTDYGFNLLISPRDLERAWGFSTNPGHAVAIGLGDGLAPLPNAPRLTAANLAAPFEAERPVRETPLAMVRGVAAQWLQERMLAERGVPSGSGVDARPADQTAADSIVGLNLDVAPPEVAVGVNPDVEPVASVVFDPDTTVASVFFDPDTTVTIASVPPTDDVAADVARSALPVAPSTAVAPAEPRGQASPNFGYVVLLLVLGSRISCHLAESSYSIGTRSSSGR